MLVSVLTHAQRADPGSASFRDVFEQNAPFAWRCLRRLGVAAADAEDVCQEVFVIVHQKLAQFDGRGSVRSWIYAICLRKASDYRRSAHVRRASKCSDVPEVAVAPNQAAVADRRTARDMLDDILGELDEKQRVIFVLYEVEQLTMTEIADTLDCPLQTAYSRLRAARKHVQAAVRRYRARRAAS